MSDFSKKQGKIENVEPTSRAPQPQGGEPTTGFVQAPKAQREKGGPGDGIPGNTRKIK